MNKKVSDLKDQLIVKASKNPKYKGKEVLIIGNKLYVISTKKTAMRRKLLLSLTKANPGSTPVIAYIPKEDTLILLI